MELTDQDIYCRKQIRTPRRSFDHNWFAASEDSWELRSEVNWSREGHTIRNERYCHKETTQPRFTLNPELEEKKDEFQMAFSTSHCTTKPFSTGRRNVISRKSLHCSSSDAIQIFLSLSLATQFGIMWQSCRCGVAVLTNPAFMVYPPLSMTRVVALMPAASAVWDCRGISVCA